MNWYKISQLKKQVILIHGWEGNPNNNWFPWLKKKLEKENFKVIIPSMPNPQKPTINAWVNKLKNIIVPNQNIYLIGHSIGCQAIMRYLQLLPKNTKIGGVIFVAGFFNLPNLETQEEQDIAKPWLEKPIDCDKIKRVVQKITAIFSDNDPDVSISDKKIFEQKLGAETIVEHNKGHFSDDIGITELPIVFKSLMDMVEN